MGCEMTSITPCLLYFRRSSTIGTWLRKHFTSVRTAVIKRPSGSGGALIAWWSTFVEEVRESKKVVGFAERATRQKARVAGRTLALSEVPVVEGGGRMDAGVGELNRGSRCGIVPAPWSSSGEPGVGKSTLSTSHGTFGEGCLMVSGEESPRQVALSARRLGVEGRGSGSYLRQTWTLSRRPFSRSGRGLWVDSIQTLYSPELSGAPGGVGQVRECGEAHAACQE